MVDRDISKNMDMQKKMKPKKPPPIRQTLTSIYRMARANPLLQQETKDPKVKGAVLPPAVTGLRKQTGDVMNMSNSSRGSLSIPKPKAPAKVDNFKVPASRPLAKPAIPRRSLSAEHFQRKRNKFSKTSSEQTKNTKVAQSLEDVSITSKPPPVEKKVTFATPNDKRRTNFQSFSSSIPLQSTPHSNDILGKLNNWLRKNGKTISAYHHLKCFGLENEPTNTFEEIDDENKENIEVFVNANSSYEDLQIKPQVTEDVEVFPIMDEQRIKSVIKDALDDLYKLIQAGYPLEQCEKWLSVVQQKYRGIEEEWQYWECRASIEQNRGNITSAVECYQTAIIKGAEVKHVDESLDQLLEKFSLLNINTSMDNQTEGGRGKQMKEVRNIFKSSIIQFAVHERTLKSMQKDKEIVPNTKYSVTPVRRSTRLSRSFKTTTTIKLCNSLHELDESVQNSMSFQKNSFLQ